MGQFINFGNGGDTPLSISADTTESPIDSACTGTINTTSLSATNASFATGQMILIIQSQGSGWGQYEINFIASYSAGTITTMIPLTYGYVNGAQVRVLRQYPSATIDATKIYTAKAWDGAVGGILAFACNGTTTITGQISAKGKGYRGGTVQAEVGGADGAKRGYGGENIENSGVWQNSAYYDGGGGGGGDYSPGGAGGGGYGTAGSTGTSSLAGTGGSAIGSADLTSLFFGGGGGKGGTWPSDGTGGNGGAGGGIVLIFSRKIVYSGSGNITCDGANGTIGSGVSSSGDTRIGASGGGGGSGGSIFLKGETLNVGTNVNTVNGGTGGGSDEYAGQGGSGGYGRIRLEGCSIDGSTTPSASESEGGFSFCGGSSAII